MRMSNLSNKAVVNINDGTVIGHILDSEINIQDGVLTSFLVDHKKPWAFWYCFLPRSYLFISLKDIRKIGDDVILVDYKGL